MIQLFREKLRFDTTILEFLLDVREGHKKFPRKEIVSALESYLTMLTKLARLTDTL